MFKGDRVTLLPGITWGGCVRMGEGRGEGGGKGWNRVERRTLREAALDVCTWDEEEEEEEDDERTLTFDHGRRREGRRSMALL